VKQELEKLDDGLGEVKRELKAAKGETAFRNSQLVTIYVQWESSEGIEITGSGCLTSKCTFITALHVIRQRNGRNYEYPQYIYYALPSKVEDSQEPEALKKCKTLKICSIGPAKDDLALVTVVATPFPRPPKLEWSNRADHLPGNTLFTTTLVRDDRTDEFTTSHTKLESNHASSKEVVAQGPGRQGHSGAAVFDRFGRLVGFHVAGSDPRWHTRSAGKKRPISTQDLHELREELLGSICDATAIRCVLRRFDSTSSIAAPTDCRLIGP